MKRMALKSKFGFTKINHNYTEEERQVTETKVLSEAHIWMPRPKQDTYINIRDTWGPPPPMAPTKNKCVPDNDSQTTSKKIRTERITNIKTTNNITKIENN